jgi:hypothetical protein
MKPEDLKHGALGARQQPLSSTEIRRRRLDVSLAKFLAYRATRATSEPGDELGWSLAEALTQNGWQPPAVRKKGGANSGKARQKKMQIRRDTVNIIMQRLPTSYRNSPSSNFTINKVIEILENYANFMASSDITAALAPLFRASFDTVKRDILKGGHRHMSRVTR